MMSTSNRDIQVHRGLLIIIQAALRCPVSSTLSTSRYKALPGSRLVIVHFCPLHFWTVSSKPNSLSLLSTSSRHRFDFLFCMEPLWGEREGGKNKNKKMTYSTLHSLVVHQYISDSFRNLSMCSRYRITNAAASVTYTLTPSAPETTLRLSSQNNTEKNGR